MGTPKSLWIPVLIAVLLHGVALYFVPGQSLQQLLTALSPKKILPIELAKMPHPLVRSSPVDEQTGQDANYVDERKNRVKKETQTKLRGPFARRRLLVPGAPLPEEGDYEARRLNIRDLLLPAQSPYKADDKVALGDDNLLNTDTFFFASYLHRMGDAIQPSWNRHIQDALEYMRIRETELMGSIYTTTLSVEIDAEGNVLAVQIVKSSGFSEIDGAPRDAIWDQEPFPNPPERMFAQNDTYRFLANFHFEWQKRTFVTPIAF